MFLLATFALKTRTSQKIAALLALMQGSSNPISWTLAVDGERHSFQQDLISTEPGPSAFYSELRKTLSGQRLLLNESLSSLIQDDESSGSEESSE